MPVRFRKVLIAAESFESASAFDVDNDGVLDIVSSGYWYKGPLFVERFRIGDGMRVDEYYDDFSTIPIDVNGDGNMDFITGGWWGGTLRWRENPGKPDVDWPEHIIAQTGNVETTRAWDIDGDGQLEIVPNTPGSPLYAYKLALDADGKGTGKFTRHLIFNQPQEHGLGFGDIDGDGRGEIVLKNGWLKAPADPLNGEWIFHDDFVLDYHASVPILVVDVNGDGLTDLIVGGAHSYGLSWYEQRINASGVRTWLKHPIDPFNGQYHDMQWADIDGDGINELITGKRYRAHKSYEAGELDDLGICYFKWNQVDPFASQFIAYGQAKVVAAHSLLAGRPEGNGATRCYCAWQGRTARVLQRGGITLAIDDVFYEGQGFTAYGSYIVTAGR